MRTLKLFRLNGRCVFHSFPNKSSTKKTLFATADYGQEWVAVLQTKNILGIPISNPEKSGKKG